MKTQADIEFDELLDKYFEKFEKNYPYVITSQLTTDEHIARIKAAIRDNKPVVEELDADLIY